MFAIMQLFMDESYNENNIQNISFKTADYQSLEAVDLEYEKIDLDSTKKKEKTLQDLKIDELVKETASQLFRLQEIFYTHADAVYSLQISKIDFNQNQEDQLDFIKNKREETVDLFDTLNKMAQQTIYAQQTDRLLQFKEMLVLLNSQMNRHLDFDDYKNIIQNQLNQLI